MLFLFSDATLRKFELMQSGIKVSGQKMSGACGISMNHFATHEISDYEEIKYDLARRDFQHFTQASHALLFCHHLSQAPSLMASTV